MFIKFNNTPLEEVSIKRIIGKFKGTRQGPTLVFFAGIHGNETAGVIALKALFKSLPNAINKHIRGSIYGISGNLKALKLNQRFLDEDLNRIWTDKRLEELKNKSILNKEEQEQIELYLLLQDILEQESGPFYFIDFHTTSSKTIPFITINDALINRNFSKLFPVPVVLGIEEYLNGPLLSYINELGYVSLGFESGQHVEERAITNCTAFIYLSLVYAGALFKDDIVNFQEYYNQLKESAKNEQRFYEVIYLHEIGLNENFKMISGFKSFQDIRKGTVLARSNSEEIKASHNAKLFMPLYQKRGNEGYFIIREIKPFFLRLSSFFRHIKADSLFLLFPGVSRDKEQKHVLRVNLKVARLMVKPIFHLLGYRNKLIDETHLKLYNRDRISKKDMYKNEFWYKKTT